MFFLLMRSQIRCRYTNNIMFLFLFVWANDGFCFNFIYLAVSPGSSIPKLEFVLNGRNILKFVICIYIPYPRSLKFQTFSLLSTEGKVFFSILSQHLTEFLLKNKHIDMAATRCSMQF